MNLGAFIENIATEATLLSLVHSVSSGPRTIIALAYSRYLVKSVE